MKVNDEVKCISNKEDLVHQPSIGKIYTIEEISGIQVKMKESTYYYLLIDFEEMK